MADEFGFRVPLRGALYVPVLVCAATAATAAGDANCDTTPVLGYVVFDDPVESIAADRETCRDEGLTLGTASTLLQAHRAGPAAQQNVRDVSTGARKSPAAWPGRRPATWWHQNRSGAQARSVQASLKLLINSVLPQRRWAPEPRHILELHLHGTSLGDLRNYTNLGNFGLLNLLEGELRDVLPGLSVRAVGILERFQAAVPPPSGTWFQQYPHSPGTDEVIVRFEVDTMPRFEVDTMPQTVQLMWQNPSPNGTRADVEAWTIQRAVLETRSALHKPDGVFARGPLGSRLANATVMSKAYFPAGHAMLGHIRGDMLLALVSFALVMVIYTLFIS